MNHVCWSCLTMIRCLLETINSWKLVNNNQMIIGITSTSDSRHICYLAHKNCLVEVLNKPFNRLKLIFGIVNDLIAQFNLIDLTVSQYQYQLHVWVFVLLFIATARYMPTNQLAASIKGCLRKVQLMPEIICFGWW